MEDKEKLKKKLEERSKEIAKQLKEKTDSKDKELLSKLKPEKVEIKDFEKVQKELEEEEKKQVMEPKKKPAEKPAKKAKVKDIEKVEKEISRQVEKVEQKKEAVKIYSFEDGIQQLRKGEKRKFIQSVDLVVSLRGMNLKKPENRLNLEYSLPSGRGKDLKVGIFADTLAAEAKKKGADIVIRKEEIPALAKDKKKLKKVANQVDWFYGEVTLMAEIGKSLGAVLGPRGKVPKPLPPKVDVGLFVQRGKRTVRIQVKESPVIHIPIGKEDMEDKDLLKNLEGVFGFVKEKLPKGINSIRSLYLKLTMGKPIKLEVK